MSAEEWRPGWKRQATAERGKVVNRRFPNSSIPEDIRYRPKGAGLGFFRGNASTGRDEKYLIIDEGMPYMKYRKITCQRGLLYYDLR
ncbi:protein of unknown function [Methylacidimicrobium sp. AP8]|nr:protein of unknown function [Methylacidimicrobium sp. AP8]